MKKLDAALNRLNKWRCVFSWWQLGKSRCDGQPDFDAIGDHRGATLVNTAQINALINLLVQKNVFTLAEFQDRLTLESDLLCETLVKQFPGFRATDSGIYMNPTACATTTQSWFS